MKLNKVMALALSGLMAVSMLAGCSSDPSNGDGGNTEVTPPASDATSVMNDALKYVTFDDDTDFNSALTASAPKATFSDAKGNYTATLIQSTANGVYKALNDKLPAGDLTTGNPVFNTTNGAVAGKSDTKAALYYIESEGLDEEVALKQVAKLLDNAVYYPEVITLGTDRYSVEYTGKVSIVEVSATDADVTETAYYIAVSITRNVSRDKVNMV